MAQATDVQSGLATLGSGGWAVNNGYAQKPGLVNDAMKVADQVAHSGEVGSGEFLDAIGNWDRAVINATGATVVFNGPCVYGGYRILANAGAFVMNVYDNVAASGQQLEATAGVSVAAAANGKQQIGEKCYLGLTVNMSGDPTDGLILVYYKAL